MDEREHDGMTPELAGRLRALRRDVPPPSHIRAALRPRRGAARWAAIAAMLIASFAAGRFTAGAPKPPVDGDRYVLFLYGGAESPDSVQAHQNWARGLASRGHLISGVKLKPLGEDVSGYFVFRAPSVEDARAIAAGCPHAQSGGRTALRQVDPL
jgi:hypothetical protein